VPEDLQQPQRILPERAPVRLGEPDLLVDDDEPIRERLLAQAALQPVGSAPREFAAVIRADIERWGKLARELGIEPQ